jgi:hypothetical protein
MNDISQQLIENFRFLPSHLKLYLFFIISIKMIIKFIIRIIYYFVRNICFLGLSFPFL